MADKIGAGWVKLAEDAFSQTETNFHQAIEVIDKKFGKDYAKAHPELIGAFLQASAIELNGTTIGACIQDLQDGFDDLADRIGFLAENIDKE
ncbi:MAG: hypothetical protein LBL04_15465 [Bacteroidales bacterium]|jgi:hypothetical protein|nr:hypothetical protein [Bacteroidales bacterium]